jgi:spermidine synthase
MRRLLYITVFITGMATLGIEFSAERLVGPAFGTSNLVWASIVGLILVYLSLGYWFGGRWADRSPHFSTLFTLITTGGFTAGLVPLFSRPVLRIAANAFDTLALGPLFGSFVVVLILLSIPVTLLGMVSPFAIRLAVTDSRQAGRISGEIYAISTAGSFLGSFLPGLVLISWIGTAHTFLTFSLVLVGLGLLGLLASGQRKRAIMLIWMPVALLAILLWGLDGTLKTTSGQVYETESAYNYIQVLELDGYRLLRLNEGQGIHSIYHPEQLDYAGPWEQFLAAPFYNPAPHPISSVQRIAIIGLAAGTTARQATAVFGPLSIDGFEIDAKIIQVGRDYFDMNLPNLNAIAQDGRWGLQQSRGEYDVIIVDAYRPPYIPWHLTTRQFFQLAYDRLSPDGVLAINVGRAPDDRRLLDGLATTIREVFPSIYVMDVPQSFNAIIYATRQPTEFANLAFNLAYLESDPATHPLLIESLRRSVAFRQPEPKATLVFDDDWSPVEWITNSMVLGFIFSGGIEALP